MSSLRARIVLTLVLLGACGEGVAPGIGPPAGIEVVTTGSLTGVVGTVVPTPITFHVRDVRGNAVSGVAVHFSAGTGATASPLSAITDAAGNASTQITLGTTATTIVLTASVTGTGVSASVNVTATHGPATALRFLTQPATALAGVQIAPLQIAIEDAHGNRAASATHLVTVALGTNPTDATLDGNASSTAVAGLATFSSLTLSKAGSGFTLVATAAGLSDVTSQTFNVVGAGRSDTDRPDDITGPQVHVVYVLPSDGIDRRLDADGVLARSVASFHNWFVQESNGLAFRFDNFGGELDVTFFRLSRTNAEMIALGAFVVTEIERQLGVAQKLVPDKKYLVYYDGGSNYACGGAAWPPNVPGQVAAMYLQGKVGISSCTQTFVESATDFPLYWEFAALHDLVHTLGIVSADAPHHTTSYPAHVPEQNDLMYSGPGAWIRNSSTTIDVGGDDYFGVNVPAGVVRLAGNPIFTTVAAALVPAPRPLRAEAAAALASRMANLPVHPPFRQSPAAP